MSTSAKRMAEIGWAAVRFRGITRGGYLEQVRGYARGGQSRSKMPTKKLFPPNTGTHSCGQPSSRASPDDPINIHLPIGLVKVKRQNDASSYQIYGCGTTVSASGPRSGDEPRRVVSRNKVRQINSENGSFIPREGRLRMFDTLN